jgi:hypothetical protein
LPGKTLKLSLSIWWLAGMSKAKQFELTRKALQQFDISGYGVADGLGRLEDRGRIRDKRFPGQLPVVEILLFDCIVTTNENTG